MRKGQSVVWVWVTVALALVFTVLLALLVGFYALSDTVALGTVAGGAVAAGGCALGATCPLGITIGGAISAAFGSFVLLTGPDAVNTQVADASDARATGVLPHLLMEYEPAGEESVGERVKECVYRESVLGRSCSYTDFESDVAAVMGDRDFDVAVVHDGSTVLSATSGNPTDGSNAAYSMLFPVKGGERARLEIRVAGRPGGVWWAG